MFKSVKVLTLLVVMCSTSVFADVNIKNVWMPELIPGRTTSAVFMKFYNPDSQEKILVSASADWARSIEIHTHENDKGVMRMRQVDSLIIPSKSKKELKRGGLHLMVFDVQETLPEKPMLSLCYSDGSCQLVEVKVRTKGDKSHKERDHGKEKDNHGKDKHMNHKAGHEAGQHSH